MSTDSPIPSKFKVGDVVVLNSGGPEMTVTAVGESGKTTSTWSVDGEMHTITLPQDCLRSARRTKVIPGVRALRPL